jgi:hypothetical protein
MSVPVQNLAQWLDVSTERLSAPAKQRIKLEIESHFQDAVEAYRNEGQTESEAQACALTDLGDAKTARKHFRKSHLTEKEAKELGKVWGGYRKGKGGGWLLGLHLDVVLLYLFCGYEELTFRAVEQGVDFQGLHYELQRGRLILPASRAIVVLVLASVENWIARHLRKPSTIRHLFTLDILISLSLLVFFAFYSGRFWCFVAVLGVQLAQLIPLWFKLARMDEIGREMLTPDAAKSYSWFFGH